MPLPKRFMPGTAGQGPRKASQVEAVHTAVAGRARLHIGILYRAPAIKAPLETLLLSLVAINYASAKPLTGNVLIKFDPALDLNELIAQITCQLSELAVPGPVGQPPAQQGRQQAVSPPSATTATTVHSLRAHRRTLGLSHRVTDPAVSHSPSTSPHWHTLSVEGVLMELGSSVSYGLAEEEVHTRLSRYGPNQLPHAVLRSELSMLLEQFMTLPVGMLAASAAVSIMTGGLLDAAVILGVVLINAGIGFYTERQAERTIGSLSKVAPRHARVFRNGVAREEAVKAIVPGDLLLLIPGDSIAADVRLVQTTRLAIDESVLTGESMPVAKSTHVISSPDIPLAERVNMGYMGTLVTGGNALGVVVATGRDTEMGKIQAMVGETRPPETPMQRQLGSLGTQLGVISAAVCGAVFLFGLLRGYGWQSMLKSATALAVAAVPEGLPAVATTTLARGIRNMGRHHVAIRHLDAVETLGSVQTLCLDKTGTLTLNHMTVVTVCTGTRHLERCGLRFLQHGEEIEPARSSELWQLLKVVALCNESNIVDQAQGAGFDGTPTENALLEMAHHSGLDVTALRADHATFAMQYRSEDRPYMLSLHAAEAGKQLIAVKGSPAEVLSLCKFIYQDDRILELDDGIREAILTENQRLAGEALRVLGVAYGEEEETRALPAGPRELIWLGLVGMTDPLRSGMAELMREFHRAGIRTVMITGDQSATAYAIGKQLGLSQGQALQILDSSHLEKLEPALLAGMVKKVHVFARVSPAHKLQIVQALQQAHTVVAMTGDGINDSPALKASDIGVAMGGADTDVARSVADVVLEDDNLYTMVTAVDQGRTIYNNIRKSIHYLVATNLSEIEVMLAGIALGVGQPLTPMQLLWINLISDIFPGLALSMEPPEPDIMQRPPRDPQEPIIRRDDLWRMVRESAVITTGSLGCYLYGFSRYGAGARANTLAFNSLTIAQLAHALSCRSTTRHIFTPPANPYLNAAIGGSLLAQLVAMSVPAIRRLLGVTPIGLVDLLAITGGAIIPLLLNEGFKRGAQSSAREQPRQLAPAFSRRAERKGGQR